jgi:hypothetical protein
MVIFFQYCFFYVQEVRIETAFRNPAAGVSKSTTTESSSHTSTHQYTNNHFNGNQMEHIMKYMYEEQYKQHYDDKKNNITEPVDSISEYHVIFQPASSMFERSHITNLYYIYTYMTNIT